MFDLVVLLLMFGLFFHLFITVYDGHPKDKVSKERKSNVIYDIKCPQCDKHYIGETKQPVGKRFTQHCSHASSGMSSASPRMSVIALCVWEFTNPGIRM